MKIDKGIAIPESRKGHRLSKYVDMEVGDSFFVAKPQHLAGSGARMYAKKTGRKFASRTVTENGITGTRVWRVE